MIEIYYPVRENEKDVMFKPKEITMESMKYTHKKLPIEINTTDNLETVFIMFNSPSNPLSSKYYQNWMKENEIYHTSMSVGDIIKIDDEFFVCDRVGWKKL